jgi:gamma-tubulin complex component 2
MCDSRRSSAAIKGVESLTFDYRVQFPLTLVLSKLTLTKYQMIFRLLFFCKHVERQMGITWRHHQSTKVLPNPICLAVCGAHMTCNVLLWTLLLNRN